MFYFRWQPFTSPQNFIHLRQSAAELLMFVQKSKTAAAAILNYNFIMLDHPRSPFVHLKFPFKFHVDRVRTFRDIAIWKFCKLGLRCLYRPPKIIFWGSFDPQTFFIIEIPKSDYLTRKHVFWAINGCDWSSGVTCRLEQVYKKRIDRTQKVGLTENALPMQTLFPKIKGSRVWPFGVTWRHRSRDHWTRHMWFPIGGPLEPCVYLAPLRRYKASKLHLPMLKAKSSLRMLRSHVTRSMRRGAKITTY